jgi:hypothetical protein
MNDARLVRGLQRVGDLLRDGQRLVEWNRTTRDALRQVVAFDQFHHERHDAPLSSRDNTQHGHHAQDYTR